MSGKPWNHGRLTRRRVLKQLATGALVSSAAPRWPLLAFGPPSRVAGAAARPASVREGKILELAHLLRTTPRERVFDVAAEQIQGGATHRELLGGTLLAGVQDVKPRPAGTKFHVVLMVPSALELAESADPRDLWLPVFFNIHTLKNSQERDVREGDWALPPAPRPLTDDPSAARKALAAALEAWDEKTADRAVTAAARLLDLDDLFEPLWPMGARDFHNIGHKMIHVAQAYRALHMIDGHHREPVLRSLVYGLLGEGPGPSTAAFDRNRLRARELPAGWAGGTADPEVSGDVLAQLRTASSERAVEIVQGLLARGVAPESIWDGLRLIASEILFRLRPSSVPNAQLLGVHALTILNAFRVADAATTRDDTRRLLLLQAAAWMPLARQLLIEHKELSMAGPGLDALEVPADSVEVDSAVRAAAADYRRGASLVLRVARDGGNAERYIDRVRALVGRKSPEHHHHKYAAAAFEEFRATHPRWSPYLLAPCLSYLPTPDDPDSDVYQRTRAALDRLGRLDHGRPDPA